MVAASGLPMVAGNRWATAPQPALFRADTAPNHAEFADLLARSATEF